MEKKFKGIKKLLAYVAAVALPIFGVVIGGSTDVYAAVTYTLSGTTLKITGDGVVDSSWKNDYDASSVKAVQIGGNKITAIGDDAFSGCSNLTSVSWANNNPTSIGDRAFKGCGLTNSVTIPASVTHIGDEAYYGNSIVTLNIANASSDISIGSKAFANCTKMTTVTIGAKGSKKATIADDAFDGSPLSTSVAINVSELAETKAFQGSKTGIVKVTIANLTGIPAGLFTDCTTLTQVGPTAKAITLPNTCLYIGDYAFKGCTGFTKVASLNKVKTIGKGAFQGCTSLTQVGATAKTVTIPGTVTLIDEYAFSGNSNYIAVKFESEPYVKAHAFTECPNITTVTLGTSTGGADDEYLQAVYPGGNIENGAFDNYTPPSNNSGDTKIIGQDEFTPGYGGTVLYKNPKAVVTFSNGSFSMTESHSGTYGTGTVKLQDYINDGMYKNARFIKTASRRDDTYVDIENGGLYNGEFCDVRIYLWAKQATRWQEGSIVNWNYVGDAKNGTGMPVTFAVAPDGTMLFAHSPFSAHTAQDAHAELHFYPANTLASNHNASLSSLQSVEYDFKGVIKASGSRQEKWNLVTGITSDGQTLNTTKSHRDYFAIKKSQVNNVFLAPVTYYRYVTKTGYEDCTALETVSREGSEADENSAWMEVNATKSDPVVINTELTCSSVHITYEMDPHVVIDNPAYVTTWGDEGISKTTQTCEGECDEDSSNDTDKNEVKHTIAEDKDSETVTINATVKDGYEFVGWDKYDAYNGTCTQESYKTTQSFTITVKENDKYFFKAITKKKPVPQYITTWGDDGVSKTTQSNDPSPVSNNSEHKVSHTTGESVTVTATVKSGYSFVRWDAYDKAESAGGKVITSSYKTTASFSVTAPEGKDLYFKAVTEKLYKATCIDVAEKVGGTELGRPTNPANPKTGLLNGTKVSGSEWGTDSPYANYAYDSCTEATINNGDVIVYRIFKLNQINLTTWGDAGISTTTQNSVESADNTEFKKAYNVGTQVTVSAKVSANHKFIRWDKYDAYNGKLLGTASTSNTYKFTLNENTYLKAVTEEVLYNAVCIDVIGDINGTELGRPAPNPKTGLSNGTKVSGSDWGTDSPYPFFDYKTCTTETINKGDVTVYRIFEPQKSIIYDVEQGKAGDGISLTAKTGGKTYNVLSLQGGDGAAAWAAQHADDCPFVPLSADNKTKLAATLNINTGAGTTNILGKTKNSNGETPNVIKDASGNTVIKFIRELEEKPSFAGTADVVWELIPALRIDHNNGVAPDPKDDVLFLTDTEGWGYGVVNTGGPKFLGLSTTWNGKGGTLFTPDELFFTGSQVRQLMQEQGTNILTLYEIYEKKTVLNSNY